VVEDAPSADVPGGDDESPVESDGSFEHLADESPDEQDGPPEQLTDEELFERRMRSARERGEAILNGTAPPPPPEFASHALETIGDRPTVRFVECLIFGGRLPLEGLTIVLGGNSSGKTTLLEILHSEVTNDRFGRDPLRRISRRQHHRYSTVVMDIDLSLKARDADKLLRLEVIGLEADLKSQSVKEAMAASGESDLVDFLARRVWTASAEEAMKSDAHSPALVGSPDELPPVEYFRARVQSGRFDFEMGDYDHDLIKLQYPPGPNPYSRFWHPEIAVVQKRRREGFLPPVVMAPAEELEPAHLTFQLVDSLMKAWFQPGELVVDHDDASLPPMSPWMTRDDPGAFQPGIVQLVRMMEEEVARLLPRWVAQEGAFRLQLLEPARWTADTRVVAGFETAHGFRRAEAVGSGSRRWLAICLRLAQARLRQFSRWGRLRDRSEARRSTVGRLGWGALGDGFDAQTVNRDVDPPLLLVDEPELHLHPEAQRAIGGWMDRMVSTAQLAGVVVATHSPSLVAAVGPDANIMVLRRGDEGPELLPAGTLSDLDRLAQEVGLGREAWLFSSSAVLLVEGEHDLAVVRRFFGAMLDRLRIRVLPLRGAKNTKRLVDSEFLGAAGLPLFVLLDNVRADAVGAVDHGGLTDEEKMMWSVRRQAQRDDIRFLPHSEPDILAALPIVTVGRRFGASALARLDTADGYWTKEIEAWRRELDEGRKRVSFKRYVAEQRLQLSENCDLVAELLPAVMAEDEPSPQLRQAFEVLEALVSDNRPL
jgi:predicted ATPase